MKTATPTHPAEPDLQRFANPLVRYFAATRPAFLSVTIVGCLIGIASAHADGVPIDPWLAALTMACALIAHAAGNVINDYHDAESGADAANTGRIYPFTGGSRFIQNGVIDARQTARFGYALCAVVVPGGLWLVAQSGPALLAIGLAGLVLGWAYSAPPLKLASRGLGEAAVAACWLLVVVGADFVQRGEFGWMPVAAGLSFALLVANLLFINQFPDHDGDAASRKRTLVVMLGPDTAAWLYLAIALSAYIWLILQVGRYNLPQACAGAALTLLLSFHAARALREHATEPQLLAPAIKLTIAAATLHGLAIAATLAFANR